MPMYEYRCRGCGHTFDQLRPVADADAEAACRCGSSDTARLPSMIARVGGGDLPMAGGASQPMPSGGGGCCGGGCCS